jgi:hypothetical protein
VIGVGRECIVRGGVSGTQDLKHTSKRLGGLRYMPLSFGLFCGSVGPVCNIRIPVACPSLELRLALAPFMKLMLFTLLVQTASYGNSFGTHTSLGLCTLQIYYSPFCRALSCMLREAPLVAHASVGPSSDTSSRSATQNGGELGVTASIGSTRHSDL